MLNPLAIVHTGAQFRQAAAGEQEPHVDEEPFKLSSDLKPRREEQECRCIILSLVMD